MRVTNLDASGPGSLRAALETSEPRIVVFEVAGVIDLNRRSLRINEPRVTVTGQTAPSPGITLIRGGLVIWTLDVSVQHLRVRPGEVYLADNVALDRDGQPVAVAGALVQQLDEKPVWPDGLQPLPVPSEDCKIPCFRLFSA